MMYEMNSNIGFEMSLIVVEAIRRRFASVMVLTTTVSEMFDGQTNSSILVVYGCSRHGISFLNSACFVCSIGPMSDVIPFWITLLKPC